MKPKLGYRPNNNQQIGIIGQNIAVKYLRTNGYRIIAQNISIFRDEVDVLARRDNKLCFIEIKTRKTSKFETAEYQFSQRKIRCLKRSALNYAHKYNINEEAVSIQGIAIQIDVNRKVANIKHFLSLI